jgi:hypothetical protein
MEDPKLPGEMSLLFFISETVGKSRIYSCRVLPRHPGEHFRVCAGYAPIASLDPVYLARFPALLHRKYHRIGGCAPGSAPHIYIYIYICDSITFLGGCAPRYAPHIYIYIYIYMLFPHLRGQSYAPRYAPHIYIYIYIYVYMRFPLRRVFTG